MSRRRGIRSSRRDRYGPEEDEKVDETDIATAPYLLATDDGTAPALGPPRDPTPLAAHNSSEEPSSLWKLGRRKKSENEDVSSEVEPLSPQNDQDIFRDEPENEDDGAVNVERGNSSEDDEDSLEGYDMTLQELMYSTSSFYAIVVPVTITMILSALAVVYVNNEDTLEDGAQNMAAAYQFFDVYNGSYNTFQAVMLSLLNGLIIVTCIGLMTFVIVALYKYNCMLCLIGYMMFASTSLLGFLGGHMWYMAIQIYNLPVDKLTFIGVLWNFAAVGVLSIFYGRGIPKYVAQGYLICTSVILAWHLSYFDDVTAWALLFMLALYDLCAVLTPCGPLKALVNLMSREDAPEMPGLLYEAELPPEARRPGGPQRGRQNNNDNSNERNTNTDPSGNNESRDSDSGYDAVTDSRSEIGSETEGPRIQVPLAVARVYNLPVIDIPPHSRPVLAVHNPSRSSNRPLLGENEDFIIPDEPNANQLLTDVIVQLPLLGGRIERIRRNGRYMFEEKDRFGNPKRILWVDRQGRVFAESADYGTENEAGGKNTIRLGLGDFIFYSVLVAKAAEYSFTTFMVCMLVIIAGLGGTLVLLSVFHHALPALPISIILGIFFYIVTRFLIEPWIESILLRPYYV
ncbi:presenilin [Nitzschia inconspicua]|uniref:Presenilin n=1 Tax=Nitzschia inconspicua TaxID=303405 RepID=A0A9K3PD46_9STRA|nr:presenilin [Nitzschia inconspicua]